MTSPQAQYRKDYKKPDYTITNVDLEFTLDPERTKVVAKSLVKRLASDSTPLVLHGEKMVLKSVLVNGEAWADYDANETSLTLTGVPEKFELTIENEISPKANTDLDGLYLSEGAYCTQCEPHGFRRITYFLDRPDVLAKYRTKVIASKSDFPFLLSNGNRIDSGDLDGGLHFVQWEDPFLKPSYLFALVAGDFDLLKDSFQTKSGREVALELYVSKGDLNRADHAMTSLKKSMAWDEERFDLEYDLDIYMIVAVDFFNMGAMENKGLNIFNTAYVLANPETATDKDYLDIEAVVGHEYFHNWTGNRVTCQDWFQLSLKEGLTVFRDQEFSSDLGSRAVNRIKNVRTLRAIQFAEDDGPMSHPIRPEKVIEMNNFYTSTIYDKGSEVIRMIHTILGEESFQKGMKLYFERHDGTAATCEDFVSAMEDASGIDLKLFRLWYSQAGTPELTVSSEYNPEAQTLQLNIQQEVPPTADQKEKQPMHIPFDLELYDSQGKSMALQYQGKPIHNVLNVTKPEEVFIFDHVPEKPIVSMLREFSAPVKLKYDYSDDELAFLVAHASNDFSRWDASQMLLKNHICQNVSRYQKGQDLIWPDLIFKSLRQVLLNSDIDAALVSLVLSLPEDIEMTGWFDTIDPEAISVVGNHLRKTVASELKLDLLDRYKGLTQDGYSIDQASIAKRSLRNTILSYLAMTEDGNQLVVDHYQSSKNMTDTMAALESANFAGLPCRENLMEDFSKKWTGNGLVMDKWFTIQAMNPAEDCLENIKRQMSHPDFDLKNPNRTTSLIARFSRRNLNRFHTKDASAYRFLVDTLIELDEINTQAAARIVTALIDYKKFDQERQELMRNELVRLSKKEGLSKGVFEKVSNALKS